MRIYSDEAWAIASTWSWTLASDTRTLAAQIDDLRKADKTAILDQVIEALTARKEESAYHADEFELLNELIEMVRGMKD